MVKPGGQTILTTTQFTWHTALNDNDNDDDNNDFVNRIFMRWLFIH